MVLVHKTCPVVWFHLTQGAPPLIHLGVWFRLVHKTSHLGVWPHLERETSQLVVWHCLEHLLHLMQGAPPSLHLRVWSHPTHKDLCLSWLGVREDCSLGECPHLFPSSHLLYGSYQRPQVYRHHLLLYQGMGSHLVEEVFPPGKWPVLALLPSCWGEHLHLVHKVLVL